MTTTAQPPHAPVLRRHKLLAAELLKGDEIALPGPEWLAFRIAQLAADCEARGEPGRLNRAWEEGRIAGWDDGSLYNAGVDITETRAVNPYPKSDARPLPAEGERT